MVNRSLQLSNADAATPPPWHPDKPARTASHADNARRKDWTSMRVGYSMWGVPGPWHRRHPDGARSYRRCVVDGLRAAGHELVFLQRDRLKAGHLVGDCRWTTACRTSTC